MSAFRRMSGDERMERIISLLLLVGVAAAAVVVFSGGIHYLVHHGADVPDYHVFRGEPSRLRSLSGILAYAISLRGRGIIQIGLLLLIITPVARVAFSLLAFARQRDRIYVIVTLIVLGVLIHNLVGGVR
jgi:uncharacterized membrane protein